MLNWRQSTKKDKGRVVLRGDIVKDDSGSDALFTEQGSSASQMTAAKIMDIISRLPGCDGQAADAVSAYTQVKMEDAPKLLKIPKSECPDIWIRLPRNKWPKSWSSMEDPVVPLDRNLYGHALAGLLWVRQLETTQQKKSRFGRTNIFPGSCIFGLQRQCEISQDIVDNYRTTFGSRISAGWSREITIPSKYSYFFMVL